MKTSIDLKEIGIGEGVVNFSTFYDVIKFENDSNLEMSDILDLLEIDIEKETRIEDGGVVDYCSCGQEFHESSYVELDYLYAEAFGERMEKCVSLYNYPWEVYNA